ncbi:hypothetical protein AAF712_016383 [Marasmius tenuissimus]|uniref:Uncharacterized protein n=1 Tax=Marasmius tenuissimus TaxID=585030 RepID=A0ABR2Z7T1_9AGAR
MLKVIEQHQTLDFRSKATNFQFSFKASPQPEMPNAVSESSPVQPLSSLMDYSSDSDSDDPNCNAAPSSPILNGSKQKLGNLDTTPLSSKKPKVIGTTTKALTAAKAGEEESPLLQYFKKESLAEQQLHLKQEAEVKKELQDARMAEAKARNWRKKLKKKEDERLWQQKSCAKKQNCEIEEDL